MILNKGESFQKKNMPANQCSGDFLGILKWARTLSKYFVNLSTE